MRKAKSFNKHARAVKIRQLAANWIWGAEGRLRGMPDCTYFQQGAEQARLFSATVNADEFATLTEALEASGIDDPDDGAISYFAGWEKWGRIIWMD